MNPKRKLTILTYAKRLKVIEAVKSGLNRKEVAVQFGINQSTLSDILKKEAELLKNLESGKSPLCKRRRIGKFPDLEQSLFTWFKECRNKNITVNGPILKAKAEEFAKSLDIHNFKASSGWLDNFKKRYDLTFGMTFHEFVACNEEAITGTLKEEVTDNVFYGGESDDADQLNDEPQDPFAIICISEARKAINTLHCFIEQFSNADDNIFYSLFNIKNKIDVEMLDGLKQKKITDFF